MCCCLLLRVPECTLRDGHESTNEHGCHEKSAPFRLPTGKRQRRDQREYDDRRADDEQIAAASLVDRVPQLLIGERRPQSDSVPTIRWYSAERQRECKADEE